MVWIGWNGPVSNLTLGSGSWGGLATYFVEANNCFFFVTVVAGRVELVDAVRCYGGSRVIVCVKRPPFLEIGFGPPAMGTYLVPDS